MRPPARLSSTEPYQVPHMSYCASIKVLSTREDGYGGTFSAAFCCVHVYRSIPVPLLRVAFCFSRLSA